jgi:two-component system alkaline phosphatase synthesis response regulator PhoP
MAESTELIRAGDLLIDAARHEVSCNGVQIELRTQEFEVLLVLARQKGKVLTREQLLNQAWGYEFYGQTRTVDVHVVHLRRALQASSVHIDTITGIGYKLVG